MSDASDSEEEGGNNKATSAMATGAEYLFKPPPPPPRQNPKSIAGGANSSRGFGKVSARQTEKDELRGDRESGGLGQQEMRLQKQKKHITHLEQQQTQNTNRQHAKPAIIDEPLQSLKDLGRQLVMESEQLGQQQQAFEEAKKSDSAAGEMARRFPPPPPTSVTDTHGISASNYNKIKSNNRSISSLSTKELSQIRRQQNNKEPSLPLRRVASDAISGAIPRAEIKTRTRRQTPGDISVGKDKVDASMEKQARIQRRKEKAERKASKLRARKLQQQQQHQQQQQQLHNTDSGNNSSQTFTLPMNDDPSYAVSRGRNDGRTRDILQAAAEIRARALRSTSRSRERVREASLFCREEIDSTGDIGDDHLSLSSEKRRSIQNPHGLEGGAPQPPAVERRSQSREPEERTIRKNKSALRQSLSSKQNVGRYDISGNFEQEETPSRMRTGGRGKRMDSRGRRQSIDDNQQPQPTTNAEELLNRRREMRQRIAERQRNAARSGSCNHCHSGNGHEQQHSMADNPLPNLSLAEEVLEGEWNFSSSRGRARSGRTSPPQRGRSRSKSRIREGIFKMRSSSLFRKKDEKEARAMASSMRLADQERGGRGSDTDMWMTVGEGKSDMAYSIASSGKRSTSSFRRILSSAKPRSPSLGESSVGRSNHSLPSNAQNEHYGRQPTESTTKFEYIGPSTGSDPLWRPLSQGRNAELLDARSTGAKSGASSKLTSASRTSLGIFKKSAANKSFGSKQSSRGIGRVRSLSRGRFGRSRSKPRAAMEEEDTSERQGSSWSRSGYRQSPSKTHSQAGSKYNLGEEYLLDQG